MTLKLLTEHHLEFLSLKGDYKGSSESTLVITPHCWKSHAAANISCAFSISPNCLAHFLLYIFTHTSTLMSWHTKQRFHTPCFKVKVLVGGQRWHVQIFWPWTPCRILKIFHMLVILNEMMCTVKVSASRSGLSERSKVTCTEFVSATDLLLWFKTYFEHMSISIWWQAEQGFIHPTTRSHS